MTINCKGKLLDLKKPKVMGILNVTPDSFYDGGRLIKQHDFIERVSEMIAQGAEIIDVGGYSSKPNADYVSEREEINRIVPIVSSIVKTFPQAILSIDTFRSNVAKAAIENGAAIINDISAGTLDPQMMKTVASLQVPYIMMHMRGNPQTMQQQTHYDNLIKELLSYFSHRISLAREVGINDLVVDPGFGFAKTTAQNFELMQKMQLLQMLVLPILVGVSRKSMIYKTLNTTAQHARNGTTALNMVALQKGAKILRVHDVKEAVECVKLYNLTAKVIDDDTVHSAGS